MKVNLELGHAGGPWIPSSHLSCQQTVVGSEFGVVVGHKAIWALFSFSFIHLLHIFCSVLKRMLLISG